MADTVQGYMICTEHRSYHTLDNNIFHFNTIAGVVEYDVCFLCQVQSASRESFPNPRYAENQPLPCTLLQIENSFIRILCGYFFLYGAHVQAEAAAFQTSSEERRHASHAPRQSCLKNPRKDAVKRLRNDCCNRSAAKCCGGAGWRSGDPVT